jgi:hypothetical protein
MIGPCFQNCFDLQACKTQQTKIIARQKSDNLSSNHRMSFNLFSSQIPKIVKVPIESNPKAFCFN